MAYDGNKPADNGVVAQGPAEIRENLRALKEDRIVDAGTVDGKHASEFEAANPAITSHIASTANPHSTTAAQVGAVAKTGDTMTGALTLNLAAGHIALKESDASDPNDYFLVERNGEKFNIYSRDSSAGTWTLCFRADMSGNIFGGPSAATIWRSDNDGAGSGLDADSVDGMGSQRKYVADAGTGWIRIAQAPETQYRIGGLFMITHGNYPATLLLSAAVNGGSANSVVLNVLQYCPYSFSSSMTKARIVYHPTPTGNYAYLEIYVGGTATGLDVRLFDALQTNWSLIDPVAGSIPAGYSAQEIVLAENQRHGIFKALGGASGNWVCPPGVYKVWVTGVGGGGGGGGTNAANRAGGGGGGGGGTVKLEIAVSPGTSYAYSVGSGGAAGNNSGGNGGTGGTTSFGYHFSCLGGGGGGGATSTTPGTGGVGGLGEDSTRGNPGGNGVYQYYHGGGGGSIFGGTSAFANGITSGISTPQPYGAGGNGGFSTSGAINGETGCRGILIIEW